MANSNLIQNRYQLLGKLGQGGMGIVYKALDRLTGEHVALKQLRVSAGELNFASKAGTDDTDKLRLSLAHEFSILATLRHPHILSVLDFGFDDKGDPFYTMELLEGATNARDYGIDLPRSRRIVLMGQMLQALHYLHRRGVLHRDLKPDNVFVTRDEQVKVMDFGLAKLEKAQSTQSGAIAGTINYMAPEQFQGGKASVASDLHAVGVVVYETMVGQHPYVGNTIGESILKIMTHTPDFSAIPDDFSPWLETTLKKDPADRFLTAYDAMAEFYKVFGLEIPPEDQTIRESFLQASTFVGREAELKLLTDALENLNTQNAFFLIGGESGIGKSRLLDELRIQALVKGVTVLRGQGVESGGLPFQLWRNIVPQLVLMTDVTDLQAGILKEIVPDIDALLEREVSDAPKLSGSAYQQRLVLTIVDLLRDIEQPLLLLLEDLQWTVESLEPLKQILLVQEQLPSLMIAASYRNDETPNLPNQLSGMTHIPLGRLDETAVKILSTAILGERGTSDELVQALQQHSEGNAFFITETIRAIADEQGSLEKVKIAEIPTVVFTGNMQDLMRRRLGQVDPQYAEIQTLAAILGREIDTQLLAHTHDATRIAAWLSNAAEYGVVDIQDNTWRFTHDKLRETLIADIAAEDLPLFHRTVAEAIESVYPDDTSYNEILLNHWQQVGDLDQIYHYLLPVVAQMVAMYGTHVIANELIHTMLGQLPDGDERETTLWNWLARSEHFQANYDASQQHSLRAQKLAKMHNDRIELATSFDHLGMVAHAQGDARRAADLYQQSLAIKQDLDDQRGISTSLNNLGIIALFDEEYLHAVDLIQKSMAIKQDLGDQHGVASSLSNLGIVAYRQGDYLRATDLYQQSLTIRQDLGDQRGIAISLINMGAVASRQGDYLRATDLYQQSIAIAQGLGEPYIVAANLANIGRAVRRQGQPSYQWFQQSLTIAHRIQAMRLIPGIIVGFAEYFIGQGQIERAGQLLGLVQAHPIETGDLSEVMPLLEAVLPPDELQAALERGKLLDLDTVVQDLLAEFGDSDDVVKSIQPKPDDKRITTTAQPAVDQPNLDGILAFALAELNAQSPDETMPSIEVARQKLSAAQISELEAKLDVIVASTLDENTVALGDIIDEVVALLRAAEDE